MKKRNKKIKTEDYFTKNNIDHCNAPSST